VPKSSSNNDWPKIIVRYRQGVPLYVPPDLPERLAECRDCLRDGKDLQILIKATGAPCGWGIPEEGTWPQLVKEVVHLLDAMPEGRKERRIALIGALEALCAGSSPEEIWSSVKPKLLSDVELISGWTHSYARQSHLEQPVVKDGQRYYMSVDGQPCEVIGKRTELEERLDYIADSCTKSYRALHVLMRLAALVNICLEIHSNPDGFPSSLLLVLPEDGGTGFIHWRWHVKWPYRPQSIEWRPSNNCCDPMWLASDLLAAFSEKEGIPEADLGPTESRSAKTVFEEKFGGFAGQLDFALETPLHIGSGEECWFEYEGTPLRWINQTDNLYAILVVPVRNRNDYNSEYQTALRFLSRLSFETDLPISVVTAGTARMGFVPVVAQPKRWGGIQYQDDLVLGAAGKPSAKRDLAYGFYREGAASRSVHYSFLSYYKVIQLPFNEKATKIKTWVNQNLASIRYPEATRRIAELKKQGLDVAEYLFEDGRCAIAHTRLGKRSVADPDNPVDVRRLREDLPIVKGLARHAIESGLF